MHLYTTVNHIIQYMISERVRVEHYNIVIANLLHYT